jgi:lipase chaperone LimK
MMLDSTSSHGSIPVKHTSSTLSMSTGYVVVFIFPYFMGVVGEEPNEQSCSEDEYHG